MGMRATIALCVIALYNQSHTFGVFIFVLFENPFWDIIFVIIERFAGLRHVSRCGHGRVSICDGSTAYRVHKNHGAKRFWMTLGQTSSHYGTIAFTVQRGHWASWRGG